VAIFPASQSVAADDILMEGGVAVCVDRSMHSREVISHALAVIGALGAPATLLHVLEVAGADRGRQDPVEWEVLRREACDMLEQTAVASDRLGGYLETKMVEGQAAEQICQWAQDHAAALIVLGTSGEGNSTGRRLGRTVRDVIDRAPGSLLLVPSFSDTNTAVRYRRILVPMDGSSRAESVLPLAIRLAKAHEAELLLAHVVPAPEMTETGPLMNEDAELRERLINRNKNVAEQYLNRVRTRITQKGVASRLFLLQGDDVRSRLAQLVMEESVDLIVLSTQGRSGRSDVPYGNVTAYMISHLRVPTLIIRPKAVYPINRIALASRRPDAELRLRNHS